MKEDIFHEYEGRIVGIDTGELFNSKGLEISFLLNDSLPYSVVLPAVSVENLDELGDYRSLLMGCSFRYTEHYSKNGEPWKTSTYEFLDGPWQGIRFRETI